MLRHFPFECLMCEVGLSERSLRRHCEQVHPALISPLQLRCGDCAFTSNQTIQVGFNARR